MTVRIRTRDASFTIKDLERFSGVKAHTIRIWEQRYSLLTPARSSGNIRLYSLDDVQRLLNICLLLKNVSRISAIAMLSSNELKQKVDALSTTTAKRHKALNHLIYYMYCDIEKFEDVLDACVQCWGIDATLEHVILPFLETASLLSYKDKGHETHFAVTAIRKKIILAVENVKGITDNGAIAVLFLPTGEHYDLYLLYTAYVLKQKGIRVLYLGTNVPISSLQKVMVTTEPNLLVTFIPPKQQFRSQDFALYLKQQHPESILYVVNCDLVGEERWSNVRFINYKSINSLEFTYSNAGVPRHA